MSKGAKTSSAIAILMFKTRPQWIGRSARPRIKIDGFVKSPISALCVSFVTAEYDQYASFLRIRKP
jgi:hypothetical protein